AQLAGAGAAILVAVVVAGRQVQHMPAEAAAPAGEHRLALALAVEDLAVEAVPGFAVFALGVDADVQHALAEVNAVDPVQAVPAAVEAVGVVALRIQVLAGVAEGELVAPASGQRAAQGEAAGDVAGIGFALVELDVGIGGDGGEAQALAAQGGVAAQAEIAVLVAVAVGVMGEGLGVGGGETTQPLVAGGDAEAAVFAAAAEGAAETVAAVAAGMQAGRGGGRVAGEDVDHAGNRVRTPDRGARTAHDLDALDLVQRQVGEVEHALAGRGHADAVHQHQCVGGVAAAQEDGAGAARAAGAGQLDADLAGQQVAQGRGLAALDL